MRRWMILIRKPSPIRPPGPFRAKFSAPAKRTAMADVLAHLHLLVGEQPTAAAMLLFGRDPQRFIPLRKLRCMHFHGTEIQRPAPYYQIFKGRLFEQVDRAADFVLSVLNLSVGTRESERPGAGGLRSPARRRARGDRQRRAPTATTPWPGAVQVSVFADRMEVWNPGVLPPELTP